jgi:glucose-1-phosphate adenylyltransferase
VEKNESAGRPRVGIGSNCKIENAIIDKNARIGNDVTISPAGKAENLDKENYFVRDGIIVIPKDAVIPHGTVI